MSRTARLEAVDQELLSSAEAARALNFIEEHLFEPLSVEIIAHHCNTTPFHFSRHFTRRHGESVMAYVRGRRLDIAAQRLMSVPGVSLASLALECGFETQSAFTRAFTRAFGKPPDAFRRSDAPPSRHRNLRMDARPQLIETCVDEGPIRLAGLYGQFDPSNYVLIAGLWKRFSLLSAGWPGRLGEETIGAFRHRDALARSFEHLAAVRIDSDAKPPPEFAIWELPAQAWLQFRQPMTNSELHVQMIAAESEIRNERLPASGRKLREGPDLQIYAPNFKAAPGWWVEHWLPVEA